jgi:DNA repair exonuclease SbcCD ATPase subunit
MLFKELIAECTYSFEHLHLTEVDFNNGGLTAIIGINKDQDTANGAGKSNILKVIYYLLFGKELNNESIDEISNRVLGRGHFGQLIFSDRGNEFKIQRYRDFRPGKKSIIQNLDGSKAKLKGIRFFINGERFGDKKPNGEATSDTEIQNIILNRIGVTPELFLMSVMTAQDSKSNFLMAADTKKKEIISELKDLEVYGLAYSELKSDIDGVEKQVSDAENRIDEINRESSSKLEEIASLAKKEAVFTDQINSEIAALRTEYVQFEVAYKRLKANKPVVQNIAEIENTLQTKEAELAALPSDADAARSEEMALLEEQSLECDSTLRKIESETSRLNGQLQGLMSELKRKPFTLNELKANIDTLTSSLPTLKGEKADLEAQLSHVSSLEEKASILRAAISLKESELRGLEEKSSQLFGKMEVAKTECLKRKTAAEVASASKKAIESQLKNFQSLPREIEALKKEEDLNQSRILIWTRRESGMEFEIARLTKEVKLLAESVDCPTCNQPWDVKHKAERDAKIAELNNEIERLKADAELVKPAMADLAAQSGAIEGVKKLLSLDAEIALFEMSSLELTEIERQFEVQGQLLLGVKQAAGVLSLSLEKIMTETEQAQAGVEQAKLAIEIKVKISQLKAEFQVQSELEAQSAALSASITGLSQQASRVRTVSNAVSEQKTLELARVLELVRSATEARNTLTKTIKEISVSLTQAKMAAQLHDQWEMNCATAQEKLVFVLKQAEQVKGRKNPYRDLMETATERIDELKGRRAIITGRIEELQEELKYMNFWKNGFGPTGVRSFISDEVIVHLNEKVRDNLNDLFDGAISVRFESESITQKGAVSNKISTKFFLNGKESPIGLLSGGERQRVVLAVDLALSDIAESSTGTKINLKFMDEPFNGIDGNGQLKSIALFAKIAHRKQGFFIITHDERFQALCGRTIFVAKEDEISKIVTKENFRAAS